MRVVIKNGDAEVECSDAAAYNPTVMRDLCDQARRTYDEAFDEDEAEVTEDTGDAGREGL